ncbi:MAG TPA: hypothetical protein VIM70_18725 [Clostridium sp.]|uniref:hypothetical protein n=1 Tax=Clostridium sp. TaxID=1506 RepID=UPI002F9494B2
MNKTKKQIIFLILIITVGICYSINTYIITPEKLVIKQKAKEIQDYTQKLKLLKSKSDEVVKLTMENKKLKEVADSIGDVTVKDIDTPQLIYDFYNSCIDYGIKGEDLVFQLVDSAAKGAEPTSGTTSSTTENNTTVNTQTNITTNKANDINKTKVVSDLLILTIELKVSGDKNNVEKYIRNLNGLTTRKINVKSIKIEATDGAVVGNNIATTGNVTNSVTQPGTTVLPGVITSTPSVTNQLTADIIFNQYLYTKDKDILRPSSYSFYNGNKGFTDFSSMFK